MAPKAKEIPKEAETSRETESPKDAEASMDLERHPVEKLQAETEIPDAVHAGTCLQMGWSRGKEVTREEYLQAVKKFKDSAGRSRHA